MEKSNRLLSLLIIASLCSACSSGGGDDDSDSVGGDAPPVGTGTLKCGVVQDGAVTTEPNLGDAKAATLVAVPDSNLIDISVGGSTERVRLLGLSGTSGFDNTAARKIVSSAAAGGLYYLPTSCTADGGKLGQLLTADGRSVAEILIQQEVAGQVSTAAGCGEDKVGSCYAALADGVVSGDLPARQVSDFLWKPDSESGYNPGGVSILLNPCDAKVLVNGEEQVDYPSGNGRCVTVRNGKPGCEFGSSVKIEVVDRDSGEPVFFGTEPSIAIPNGCDRFEYDGIDTGSSEPEVPCSAPVADFKYSPAYEACGGNAAVILSGELQGAFSVQLRLPDGGDRLDESCGERSCSPYKVQQYIDGNGVKVACFGAPGDSVLMNDVVHSSIKMSGDDSTPYRYCIADPEVAVN